MKLSDKLFSSIREIANQAMKLAAQKTQEQTVKPKPPPVVVHRDGFTAQGKQPVSLGKMPSASAAGDAAYVQSLYRELLGREPDAEGMKSHLRGLENGMTRDEIKNVFLTSPEFMKRVQDAFTQLAGQTGVGGVGGVGATTGTPGVMPAVTQGVGPVPLEGYDATKLNNLDHRTVKYQFGRVASHFSLSGVTDKQSAEALLKSMVPALEAAGLKVHEVKGDKIRVDTPLGQEWVDVVRGAGSGQPGWWWGSEGKAIPGTEGTGTQAGGGVGGTTPGGSTGQVPPGFTETGAPLSSVPMRPEYFSAPIDMSSMANAVKSAAQWVKDTYPQLMARASDRAVDKEIMTHVIGALRAHGLDATRVVNHPTLPTTDPVRWGSDSVQVGGRIWDVFIGMGEQNTPAAQDVGAARPDRPRE